MSPVIMFLIHIWSIIFNSGILLDEPEFVFAVNLLFIIHFVQNALLHEIFVFWLGISSWLCQIDIGGLDLFVSDFATIVFEMLQVVFIGDLILTSGILTLELEAVENTLLNLVEAPYEFSTSTFFETFKLQFCTFTLIPSGVVAFFAVIQIACPTDEGFTLCTLDGLDNNTVAEHTNEVLKAIRWECSRIHVISEIQNMAVFHWNIFSSDFFNWIFHSSIFLRFLFNYAYDLIARLRIDP